MNYKNNGQISLDLLFSLIVVLLFITSMFYFVNIYKESKENINLQNSMKIKSDNISGIINTAKTMEDTNFEIKQKMEFINYKNELILPNIYFDKNSVTLNYNDLNIISYFAKNDFNIFIENNYLVIKK